MISGSLNIANIAVTPQDKERLDSVQPGDNEIFPLPTYAWHREESQDKVRVKKGHIFKTWQTLKNSNFLFYPHETLWKWLPHEVIMFTKFHESWKKDVDFYQCPS